MWMEFIMQTSSRSDLLTLQIILLSTGKLLQVKC